MSIEPHSFLLAEVLDNFNVEVECRIWWNSSWMSGLPIRVIRRGCDASFRTSAHLNDGFLPSLDDCTCADLEFEAFFRLVGVKLLPVFQCSRVADCHPVTVTDESTSFGSIALLLNFEFWEVVFLDLFFLFPLFFSIFLLFFVLKFTSICLTTFALLLFLLFLFLLLFLLFTCF